MKRFPYFALFLTMLITACGNISGAVATSTSLPTITPPPTNTPTQMPTATSLPSPTATEQLTHQEQLERDYGHLVPLSEKCVPDGFNDLIGNMDLIPTDTRFARLQLHATGNVEGEDIKTITVPWGEEKKLREVEVLRVVGRCDSSDLNKIDVMWLVIGGDDFGKNQDGTAVYWYKASNGNSGRRIMTVQELKTKISEGLLITVDVPIQISSPNVPDRFGDYYGVEGYSNELYAQGVRTFYDNEATIKQIVAGGGVNQNDWVIYPIFLKVDTDLKQNP